MHQNNICGCVYSMNSNNSNDGGVANVEHKFGVV